MAVQSVNSPRQIFTDIDGQPLESGFIYIGTAGLQASTNQISVYWDSAKSIPATQPIRTTGGYPMQSGSPGTIYLDASDFSIEVNNKNNSSVLSALNSTERISSDILTYQNSGSGSIERTVDSKLSDSVSVKDFGAVGDGVTDDTAAFIAALSASSSIYVPIGDYLVGNIPVTSQYEITGENMIFTRLLANANGVDIFTTPNATFLVLENFSALANGFTGVNFLNQTTQALYIARSSFIDLNLHADLQYCFNGVFIYGLWSNVTCGLSGSAGDIHVAVVCEDDSAVPSQGHAANINRFENCQFSHGESTVTGEAMVNFVNGDLVSFEDTVFESASIPAFRCESIRGAKFLSVWFESIDSDYMLTEASGGVGGHTSSISMDNCHMALNIGPNIAVVSGDAATSVSIKDTVMLLGQVGIVMFAGGVSVRKVSNLTYDSTPVTLTYPTTDPVEGTWTPEFVNIGTGTYSLQTGEFTRVGNLVVCSGAVAMNSLGTASGALKVSGLPFTSKSGSGLNATFSVSMQNMSSAKADSVGFMGNNATEVSVYGSSGVTGLASASAVTHADFGSTGELYFTISYRTDVS